MQKKVYRKNHTEVFINCHVDTVTQITLVEREILTFELKKTP